MHTGSIRAAFALATRLPAGSICHQGRSAVCSQRVARRARFLRQSPVVMGAPELVSAREVQSRKDAGGWTHVDVRTPAEFEGGHPPASTNVPFMLPGALGMSRNPAFLDDFAAAVPGKDAKIIVSCQSGKRSAMAVQALVEAGYENLADQEGGFNAWSSDETLAVAT